MANITWRPVPLIRWLVLGILICVCGVVCGEELHDLTLLSLLAQAPSSKDYPDDAAVWLLRDVQITLEENGACTVHEHQLLKLLSEQALSRANWQIPYDKSCETLRVPIARTLLNGVVFSVDPQQMVESALYPGLAWYDALVVRRFPLPAARVGATLEVDTVQRRVSARMPEDFSTRLQLQDALPIVNGRFQIRVPPRMHLAIRFTGPHPPKISETVTSAYRSYAWTSQHEPALRMNEPLSPCAEELVDSARVSCRPDWEPVVAWYRGLVAGKDRLSDALRQAAATCTAGCTTREDKIAALYKAVRELPYVALEMGEMSDVPHAADAVFQQHYGDCKDKATLLRALLSAAGIASDYVLVRTTDHGRLDRQLYSPSEFNHVILAVPQAGGDHFLDATIADAPADQLPPGVEGADALIIRGPGEIVTLPTSFASANHTEISVELTVKADGSASGTATLTFRGQTAVMQRGLLSTVANAQYRDALESTLAPRLGNEVAVDAVEVAHLREPEQPLVLKVAFSSHAYVQTAGTQLSGFLPVFMYQPNHFRSTGVRRNAVLQRMESSMHLDTTITLPPTLSVVSVPRPVQYAGLFGEYHDQCEVAGNTIHFRADLANKRGLFPPDSLEALRTWSAVLALDGRNQLQFFLRRD